MYITVKETRDLDVQDVRDAVWGGAKDTVSYLTDEELELVLECIEEVDGDEEGAVDLTTLNDILAFDVLWIADVLGYEDFDEIMDR